MTFEKKAKQPAKIARSSDPMYCLQSSFVTKRRLATTIQTYLRGHMCPCDSRTSPSHLSQFRAGERALSIRHAGVIKISSIVEIFNRRHRVI